MLIWLQVRYVPVPDSTTVVFEGELFGGEIIINFSYFKQEKTREKQEKNKRKIRENYPARLQTTSNEGTWTVRPLPDPPGVSPSYQQSTLVIYDGMKYTAEQ